MALQSWIDKIADRWARIETHDGGSLRSHRIYTSDDFPESITAPAVITYPKTVNLTYSSGGPIFAHWYGQSDFYLFDNVSKSNFPRLIPYFEKIMIAAFGSITLGSTVVNFSIGSNDLGSPSMQLSSLQYGDNDSWKHGIIVNWYAKDDISNDTGISVVA